MILSSLSNPRIKQIRKLRERKERQQSGLFFLEGLRIVTEAVQSGADIETLIVAPELLTSEFGQNLVEKQAEKHTPLLEVSKEVFESLSSKEGPQGLAAVVRQQWLTLDVLTIGKQETWVALDSVADPGNLGTIMRSHDAVGGRGIILLDQSTDPYDSTAIRASMGALFTQSLVRTNLDQFAKWKKQNEVCLVGTSGGASQDYQTYHYPTALVLLMGSERQGLLDQHFALCDTVVKIPMVGRSDSLNLGVATSVVLYEIFNQRRNSTGREGLG